MEEVKKMLRIVISGQSSMKGELLKEISRVDGKLNKVEQNLKKRLGKVENKIASN